TNNSDPVLVLVSEIPMDAPRGHLGPQQATELDSLAFHQNEALRQAPAHGLVFFVRKRGSGLVRDRIGIGRDHNADICVASPRISRYHAFFSVDARHAWTITDANSKNGSSIAGLRLAAGAARTLANEASIMLGGIEFCFYLPEEFVAHCSHFLHGDAYTSATAAG
ncbi:MAG TPA: FHA domain-containing protein, partial [Polyangium sp.]|nr:FHA domain-containing protein [Polyangium sp.]